jgi:hypothetical protein
LELFDLFPKALASRFRQSLDLRCMVLTGSPCWYGQESPFSPDCTVQVNGKRPSYVDDCTFTALGRGQQASIPRPTIFGAEASDRLLGLVGIGQDAVIL